MTGELVVFRYGFVRPYLTWAVIGRDGTVRRAEEPIALDRPFMIHDFVVTEHYLVFFICPGAFDMTGPASSVFQWRPELGTRIALVPRHGSDKAIRWIDAEAFWVWHFANAFERLETDGSTTVTVDFPRWSHLGFGNAAPATCGVVRAEIRLADGSVKFDQRDDQTTEFPRIDDRRIGRPHRWFYVAAKESGGRALPVGEWNQLRRYDMHTGQVVSRNAGSLRLGEPVFVPAGSDASEDQGYVVTFATDAVTLKSYFLILHAGDIAGEPAATLLIPQRVPAGLHGCWVAGV
jgi:carotenoid cleavage dioxygenase